MATSFISNTLVQPLTRAFTRVFTRPMTRTIHRKAITGVVFMLMLALTGLANAQASVPIVKVEPFVDEELRSPNNIARDKYRNPFTTLTFLGVKPWHTVVELWPGGGWYSEILAPYLQQRNGKLYAAHYGTTRGMSQGRRNSRRRYEAWVSRFYPETVEVTDLSRLSQNIAPPESADIVLTFRNVHNWMDAGYLDKVFAAAFKALKHGGYLGIVEHRAPFHFSLAEMIRSGYVSQSYVVIAATNAGFQFVRAAEINANPRDTKNHPHGVWSLPPSLRGGKTTEPQFLPVGESDRMTLLFIKK